MPKKSNTTAKAVNTNNGVYKLGEFDVSVGRIKNAMYFAQSDTTQFTLETEEGYTFYNLMIAKGKKGKFISFPARKGTDGNYYNYYYIAFTDEEKAEILAAIESLLTDKASEVGEA